MASILICCTPAHGHVFPLLTVARHLVAQGHDVRMLTGTRYRDAVAATGAEFIPMPPGADIDLDHVNDLFPERAAMKPIPQLRFSVEQFGAAIEASPGLPAIDLAIADLVALSRTA